MEGAIIEARGAVSLLEEEVINQKRQVAGTPPFCTFILVACKFQRTKKLQKFNLKIFFGFIFGSRIELRFI